MPSVVAMITMSRLKIYRTNGSEEYAALMTKITKNYLIRSTNAAIKTSTARFLS